MYSKQMSNSRSQIEPEIMNGGGTPVESWANCFVCTLDNGIYALNLKSKQTLLQCGVFGHTLADNVENIIAPQNREGKSMDGQCHMYGFTSGWENKYRAPIQPGHEVEEFVYRMGYTDEVKIIVFAFENPAQTLSMENIQERINRFLARKEDTVFEFGQDLVLTSRFDRFIEADDMVNLEHHLLQRQANQHDISNVIQTCVEKGSIECLKYLFTRPDLAIQDEMELSRIAIANGNVAILKFFCERGTSAEHAASLGEYCFQQREYVCAEYIARYCTKKDSAVGNAFVASLKAYMKDKVNNNPNRPFYEKGEIDQNIETTVVTDQTNLLNLYDDVYYPGNEMVIYTNILYVAFPRPGIDFRIICFRGPDHIGKTSVVKKISLLAAHVKVDGPNRLDGILVIENDEKLEQREQIVMQIFKNLEDLGKEFAEKSEDTLTAFFNTENWLLSYILPTEEGKSNLNSFQYKLVLTYLSALMERTDKLRVIVRLPYVDTKPRNNDNILEPDLGLLSSDDFNETIQLMFRPDRVPNTFQKLRKVDLPQSYYFLEKAKELITNGSLTGDIVTKRLHRRPFQIRENKAVEKFFNEIEVFNSLTIAGYDEIQMNAMASASTPAFSPHLSLPARQGSGYGGGSLSMYSNSSTLNAAVPAFHDYASAPATYGYSPNYGLPKITVEIQYGIDQTYPNASRQIPTILCETLGEVLRADARCIDFVDEDNRDQMRSAIFEIRSSFQSMFDDIMHRDDQEVTDEINANFARFGHNHIVSSFFSISYRNINRRDHYSRPNLDHYHSLDIDFRLEEKNSQRKSHRAQRRSLNFKQDKKPQLLRMSTAPNVLTTTKKKKPKPQNRYRARQDLVQNKRKEVKDILGNRLVPETEYLRGSEVLFIPSKSPNSLENIVEFVKAIDDDPAVEILKAALPLSRKNEYQLKGFLCYLKLRNEDEVEHVKNNIYEKRFKNFFQKCVAAEFHKTFEANSKKQFKVVEESSPDTPNTPEVDSFSPGTSTSI